MSRDNGKTWTQPETPIRFKEGSDKKINRVWQVEETEQRVTKEKCLL